MVKVFDKIASIMVVIVFVIIIVIAIPEVWVVSIGLAAPAIYLILSFSPGLHGGKIINMGFASVIIFSAACFILLIFAHDMQIASWLSLITMFAAIRTSILLYQE